MNKEKAISAIQSKKEVFTALSDTIWEYAELSLQEYKSAALYIKTLRELGFEVEEKIADIDTAFLGKFGSGRPVIGILGEFDALTGLSQEAGALERKSLAGSTTGHGCGHHLLGAGALAAAYGIKEYLRTTGKEGTVIFYGTPGEEGTFKKASICSESFSCDISGLTLSEKSGFCER